MLVRYYVARAPEGKGLSPRVYRVIPRTSESGIK